MSIFLKITVNNVGAAYTWVSPLIQKCSIWISVLNK